MYSNFIKCNKCNDIHSYLQKLQKKFPTYHCKPVGGYGNINSKIALFGLAPGLHGANKTGIPFTSDFSGDLIRKLLNELNMDDIFISNAVRCYPYNNKPSAKAINNCLIHSEREVKQLSHLRVIITLGSIAYYQILKLYKLSRKNHKFFHSNAISLSSKILLISSYHCSKLNINTKKINYDMLRDLFIKAKEIANDR